MTGARGGAAPITGRRRTGSGDGKFQFTETNAYSGDNGRAAITAEAGGKELIYTSGNAGNGSIRSRRGDPGRGCAADHAVPPA